MARKISRHAILTTLSFFLVVVILVSLNNSSPPSTFLYQAKFLKGISLQGAYPQPAAPSVDFFVSENGKLPNQYLAALARSKGKKKEEDSEVKSKQQKEEDSEVKSKQQKEEEGEVKPKKQKEEGEVKKSKQQKEEEMREMERTRPEKFFLDTFDVPPDMHHDPAGPEPDEIVLLMGTDGKATKGLDHIFPEVMENRQQYADLHGYHYQFLNISKYDLSGAEKVWAKLPAVVEAFNLHPRAKWVWWLDLDALIMTPSVDLRSYLLSHEALDKKILKGQELKRPGNGVTGVYTSKNPNLNDIDLIITQDQNGLNAGSFFLRRSLFTKWLIDVWSDPLFVKQHWAGKEQQALYLLMKEHSTLREHMALVNLNEINAYALKNVKDWSWEKDVHIAVHFAGCWVSGQCAAKWDEYKKMATPASAVKDSLKKHPSGAAEVKRRKRSFRK